MTKTEAIQLFNTRVELARALGITKSAVSQWPEVLPPGTADRIVGAAVRTGRLQTQSAEMARPGDAEPGRAA